MSDKGNEPAANSTCTPREEMSAYDRLPRPIRRSLSKSPYNFDATGILTSYRDVKVEHDPWATHIILDWLDRCVAKQRVVEIKEGRLLPDA